VVVVLAKMTAMGLDLAKTGLVVVSLAKMTAMGLVLAKTGPRGGEGGLRRMSNLKKRVRG